MNEQIIAKEIAEQVISSTNFWIAIIGLIGTLIGAAVAVGGNLLLHWVQDRKASYLDSARIKLLTQMLNARDWRKLSTLSRVIGADDDTTRRLLIKLGARGSETTKEGDELWGLISKHPLDQIE